MKQKYEEGIKMKGEGKKRQEEGKKKYEEGWWEGWWEGWKMREKGWKMWYEGFKMEEEGSEMYEEARKIIKTIDKKAWTKAIEVLQNKYASLFEEEENIANWKHLKNLFNSSYLNKL